MENGEPMSAKMPDSRNNSQHSSASDLKQSPFVVSQRKKVPTHVKQSRKQLKELIIKQAEPFKKVKKRGQAVKSQAISPSMNDISRNNNISGSFKLKDSQTPILEPTLPGSKRSQVSPSPSGSKSSSRHQKDSGNIKSIKARMTPKGTRARQ